MNIMPTEQLIQLAAKRLCYHSESEVADFLQESEENGGHGQLPDQAYMLVKAAVLYLKDYQ